MSGSLDVLPIGTEVIVGEDIPGRITAIFIRSPGVQYEVAFWDGRQRRTECLPDDEFRIADRAVTTRTRIGYSQAC